MREDLQGFLEDVAIVVAPGYVSQVEMTDTGVQRQARRLPRRQMAEFVRQVGFDVEVSSFDDQRIGPPACFDQVVCSGAIAYVDEPGTAAEGAEDVLRP